MTQVLLRRLNDFKDPVAESEECSDTTVEQIRKKLFKLGFEFCCIKLSGNPHIVELQTGMKDKENKILDEIRELVNKPLNKSDIMRTLTRHSVGILHWRNHCQATVTCVGKNLVLAPAHIFQQDTCKFEIWDHLLMMYCERVLKEDSEAGKQENEEALRTRAFCYLRKKGHNWIKEKSDINSMEESFQKFIEAEFEKIKQFQRKKDQSEAAIREKSEAAIRDMHAEIEKLSKIKEEQLVNLKPEEMKIHIGYTEEVHDHFRENCCKYFVDEVMMINHELDFSLLKVRESHSFKGTKELSARQKLVPMVLGSADFRKSQIYMYVASHPLNRTLSIENSVKILETEEKHSFVENFHFHAIVQAVTKNKDSILRHTSKSFVKNVPNIAYLHKYETDDRTKQLLKRSYSEGDVSKNKDIVLRHTSKSFLEYIPNIAYFHKYEKDSRTKQLMKRSYSEGEIPGSHSRPTHKLLLSLENLKDGRWHSYSLKDFWHCDIPKRKNLQIPIPKPGTNNPYRIIITSRREQMSFACEITEDGGDDKQGILRIKKLDSAIIVEEKPTNSVFLSLVSEKTMIKCAIENGKLFVNDDEKSEKNGTFSWETSSGAESNTDLPEYELRRGESCHFHEISLTLQNKKLHYSVKEEMAQPRFILCLEEKIIKLELEDEVNRENEINDNCNRVVKIKVDGEEHSLNIDTSQSATRQKRCGKRKGKECIHLENLNDGNNWAGNILMKRKCKKGSNGDRYCSLGVKWDTIKKNFTYKANWVKSRKWTLTEGDTNESYVIWPTDSLSSNFELQFQNKKKSHVTLSLIIFPDSHRVVELDPDGRKIHGSILRQVNARGKPRESEFPPVRARLEKVLPSDENRRFVQNLFTSFNDKEQKERIINKDILNEGKRKYMGNDDKFEHLKLLDMEYGASGGACCYLDNQGQVTLLGMLLGACPPFYYNDEECKLFFNKTGTCFNKILPSERIKYVLEELLSNQFSVMTLTDG